MQVVQWPGNCHTDTEFPEYLWVHDTDANKSQLYMPQTTCRNASPDAPHDFICSNCETNIDMVRPNNRREELYQPNFCPQCGAKIETK